MNGLERAQFWKEFVLTKCQYPAPERLEAQLAAAVLHDFCQCGCNSFETSVAGGEGLLPLAEPGGSGMFFEADFRMKDGRQLEVLLFADIHGNLAGIDVECQGNTERIPEHVEVSDKPFYVWSSEKLIRP